MREIKFRAWDKANKVMGRVSEIEWRDIFFSITVTFKGKRYDASGGLKHFELMQYTGLKDKNGKEIYEGDIFGRDCDCGECDNFEPEQVVFEEGAFILEESSIPLGEDNETGKVIGNIHENPELIK